MDPDELEPRERKPKPKTLDDRSVDALRHYIVEFETEIERARSAIDAKKRARAGAEAPFKK